MPKLTWPAEDATIEEMSGRSEIQEDVAKSKAGGLPVGRKRCVSLDLGEDGDGGGGFSIAVGERLDASTQISKDVMKRMPQNPGEASHPEERSGGAATPVLDREV